MIHTGARHGVFATSLGELLLVAEDSALTGVYFPDHTYPPDPETIGDDLGLEPDDEVLSLAAFEIREYLAGDRQDFSVPVAPQGDGFEVQVWEILRALPFGTTTTYGEIAAQFGKRSLAQRVGQAVGHNPISIIIPCHRVLGADGSLTGFAGGLEAKRTLLALEEPSAEEAGRLF